MDHTIDFVITELEVKLRSYDNPFGCFASFIFVDEKPAFPRVRKTLNELNKHQDAFVLGHTYSYKDITSKTEFNRTRNNSPLGIIYPLINIKDLNLIKRILFFLILFGSPIFHTYLFH